MKATRQPITYEEIAFLRESNNIEDEWDDLSLQQSIHAWDYALSQKAMTPSVVLKTHKILMLHHLTGMYKGYFRREPVWIGGHEAKPWFVVPELIENWCDKVKLTINQSKSAPKDVIEDWCKKDHIEYEGIHPFIDGNGRTGRIFYNWERVRCGLPIDVILEKEKFAYYDWFK